NYAAGSSWVDLATFPDQSGEPQFFGLFYKIDLKSLVWYSPDNLDDAGYDVPTTMEELLDVSASLAEDGEKPWCIGLGSGDATGWPATDWVEDLMLRLHTPDVYDAWVTNAIPFDDPRVIEAIDTFGSFARNPDWVDGGVEAVGAGDFRDSVLGLFAVPPKCYFHRQASFIPAFFPEDVELGLDADFFYFPSYEAKELGNPILGGGSLWAITNDSDASRALVDFFTTALAHELWMANSSFLTPHKGANLDAYLNDTLRKQGGIILDATVFRFDASDLMPGAIGAGSFWTGMIDYVGGAEAAEVTGAIQETWNAIK
ncbi:MAG: ABC transporter substrate-binding protein, partial [Pseudomonadota bacterium]